ncbi:MAG TPA: hypothetical protein VFS38_06100 [Actinomycetota bacterium]|nr:hypothetical protein [Actinomycetota bacterium]
MADEQAPDQDHLDERVRAELRRAETLSDEARLKTLKDLHECLEAELDQAAPPRH